MIWIRGDQYYLTCDRFNIARVNCGRFGKTRRYELWDKKTKELIAAANADDDEEAQRVCQQFKELAEAM